MKYFSTFSGIGGFELAMPEDWECVGFSEIDKYAIQIYNKHFNHKNYGDITKIATEDIPDFDLLVGGFPCQSFSIAGKRRGFADTRGTLFFELARILKDKRPKYFVFENVKGLLSHNGGLTFKTIIATIDELGYDCQWQVLNSKNFGVPQNRERVFIVGHLRGISRPEVFPIRENSSEDIILPTITSRITADSNGTYISKRQTHKKIKSSARGFGASGSLVDENDITPTLTTSMGTGGNNVPMIVASRGRNPDNPSDRTTGHPTEQRLEPNSQGITNTLTNVQKDNWLINENRIRRLTPVECERLQGFPDGWTDCVSDTQRYKTLGNAVTVNTVRAIINNLTDKINKLN
jgi:DNA (cytosine-5)-methyltransferase 1